MESFTSPFIVPGPDGKPVFIGKEQPAPQVTAEKGAQMQCPVCNQMFDYLVGDDTPDGGRRGCEGCYKPGKERRTNTVNQVEEVIS